MMNREQDRKSYNIVIETTYMAFFLVLLFSNTNAEQENTTKTEKKWFDRVLASEYSEKQDPKHINLSLEERLDLALSQNVWPDQFVVDDFVFDLMVVPKEFPVEQETNIESWKAFLTAYVLETDPEKYSETQIETVNRLLDGFIPECIPPYLPQEVRDILQKKPKDLENEQNEFLIRLWETTIARAVVHADSKNKRASSYRGGFNEQQRLEYLKLLPKIFPDFLPDETKELINKPPEHFLEYEPRAQRECIKRKYRVDISSVFPIEIHYFLSQYFNWKIPHPLATLEIKPGTNQLLYPEGRYVYPDGTWRLIHERFGIRSYGEGIVVVRYHDQGKITVEPFSEKHLVSQDHIFRYDKFQQGRFFGNILYIIDDSLVAPDGYRYVIDLFEPPVLVKIKDDPQPKPAYEFQLL